MTAAAFASAGGFQTIISALAEQGVQPPPPLSTSDEVDNVIKSSSTSEHKFDTSFEQFSYEEFREKLRQENTATESRIRKEKELEGIIKKKEKEDIEKRELEGKTAALQGVKQNSTDMLETNRTEAFAVAITGDLLQKSVDRVQYADKIAEDDKVASLLLERGEQKEKGTKSSWYVMSFFHNKKRIFDVSLLRFGFGKKQMKPVENKNAPVFDAILTEVIIDFEEREERSKEAGSIEEVVGEEEEEVGEEGEVVGDEPLNLEGETERQERSKEEGAIQGEVVVGDEEGEVVGEEEGEVVGDEEGEEEEVVVGEEVYVVDDTQKPTGSSSYISMDPAVVPLEDDPDPDEDEGGGDVIQV